MIVAISNTDQRAKRKAAGKEKAGRRGEFSLFLIDVIKYSEHENPACYSAEIINNIVHYFQKYGGHYMTLIIEAIDEKGQRDIEKRKRYVLEYSELGRPYKPLKWGSLQEKINELRRGLKKASSNKRSKPNTG